MTGLSDTMPDSAEPDGNELLNRAIEAYYSDVAKAVGRRSPSQNSALDIVHDLYIKLSSQPEVLRDKRSIKAFLCRAAVNLGIDRYRREQFEARLFTSMEQEVHQVPASSEAPDNRLETEARLRVLCEAIGELPVRRRAVFILHRLHHLTPDEIAARLNISRNMVDRHLRRALTHCLDCLLQMD
ncbi:RNA polymerase sigma factor [Roseibium aggregatum]|uniref:RNA polymerase sigma factor n=1 Tax=Roseibium aggregatum TaxID=187304 RepID=A0A939E9Y9_9HYPH|nr:RNA polymerase sigma factor [Roseibium aggregatum]MBN9668886.1 RNA polymerase sigma factor [Roseibium aggregatum]